MNTPVKIGILSISDRAANGVYQDEGIPALKDWLESAITSPFELVAHVIADERETIEKRLLELVDNGCHLILTTGGTGPARRDVTPEATLAVGTREMPGFGERMRAISMHFVPTAILSRQTAVICERPNHLALIVNLPGRPASIKQILEGVREKDGTLVEPGIFTAIPYCIELMEGPVMTTNEAVCKAWRPAKKK